MPQTKKKLGKPNVCVSVSEILKTLITTRNLRGETARESRSFLDFYKFKLLFSRIENP